MSYKKQELLTIREPLGSPIAYSGVHVAHLFSFLCCLSSSCVLCPILPVSLDCPFLIPLWFSLTFIYPWFKSYNMQEVVLNYNACSKFVVLLSIKFIIFESLVYVVDIFSLNIFYLRIFQLYLFVYMVDISD